MRVVLHLLRIQFMGIEVVRQAAQCRENGKMSDRRHNFAKINFQHIMPVRLAASSPGR